MKFLQLNGLERVSACPMNLLMSRKQATNEFIVTVAPFEYSSLAMFRKIIEILSKIVQFHASSNRIFWDDKLSLS